MGDFWFTASWIATLAGVIVLIEVAYLSWRSSRRHKKLTTLHVGLGHNIKPGEEIKIGDERYRVDSVGAQTISLGKRLR